MQLAALDYFFEEFATEQMNFIYAGDFSDEHTEVFIELNNLQFSAHDEIKLSQRKAAFLIAECFQNIIRYHDPSHRDSYFHVNHKDGLFKIISGNRIDNRHIPTLQSQLEQLNKLTAEELKEVYRKVLMNGETTTKGGAGLGLIEMARKTKNKLSFSFSAIDKNTSYFYFSLHLKWDQNTGKSLSHDFGRSISLRNKVLREQLFFAYKGILSTETTAHLLSVMKHTDLSMQQKVLFVRFMGTFEKLTQSGLPGNVDHAAILLMGETKKAYSIGATCLLNHQSVMGIERSLKLYRSYDEQALKNAYQSLKKEADQNQSFQLMLLELLLHKVELEFNYQSQSEGVTKANLILNFNKKQKAYTATKQHAGEISISIQNLELDL
ncbi:MAG: SiaB family protein kinase [Vicingaceae bacterium]